MVPNPRGGGGGTTLLPGQRETHVPVRCLLLRYLWLFYLIAINVSVLVVLLLLVPDNESRDTTTRLSSPPPTYWIPVFRVLLLFLVIEPQNQFVRQTPGHPLAWFTSGQH